MNGEVFQMDEARAEYWKGLGVNTRVGCWYLVINRKLYGHFETQREADINRDYILQRLTTGCAGGNCE